MRRGHFHAAILAVLGITNCFAADTPSHVMLDFGQPTLARPLTPTTTSIIYPGQTNVVGAGNQNIPVGLQHFRVDPVKIGRSRGVSVRPLVSYTTDPQQTKVEQVWVGTSVSYSF